MAELADALDLGSSAERRGGSSPFVRTNHCLNIFLAQKTMRCAIQPDLHDNTAR
jgi:hypothetical protein